MKSPSSPPPSVAAAAAVTTATTKATSAAAAAAAAATEYEELLSATIGALAVKFIWLQRQWRGVHEQKFRDEQQQRLPDDDCDDTNNIKNSNICDMIERNNSQFEEEEEEGEKIMQTSSNFETTKDNLLPQSAQRLLNTLQHGSNFNNNRGVEEILTSFLRRCSSGNLGNSFSFSLGDDDNNDDDDGSEASGNNEPRVSYNEHHDDERRTYGDSGNSYERKSSGNEDNYNYNNINDDDDDDGLGRDMARLDKSIARIRSDLKNIDMSTFDGMMMINGSSERVLLDDNNKEDGSNVSSRSRNISSKWTRWIRNCLLSLGIIINNDKVVNELHATEGREGNGDESASNYVFILTILSLVFFVLFHKRFMNELEDDSSCLSESFIFR
jgi:hypothetical protein